jgi:septum formation protein
MLSNLKSKKIILASKSPRRQELLKGLDIQFEIKTKEVDESYPLTMKPEQVPVFLAEKKADAFVDLLEKDTILITSDTIVIQGKNILEKPNVIEEGKAMIRKLSGQVHTVVTGVCIRTLEKSISFSDETRVLFTDLTDDEIDYYMKNYQPFDKAGSYGVQEWIGYVGIERLEGSYYNVMGLPVHKVYTALKTF